MNDFIGTFSVGTRASAVAMPVSFASPAIAAAAGNALWPAAAAMHAFRVRKAPCASVTRSRHRSPLR